MKTPPTRKELLEIDDYVDSQDLILKETKFTDHTRWGVYQSDIIYRCSDDSYWKVSYEVASGDGDYHGIVENSYTIVEVMPIYVTVIDYIKVPDEKDFIVTLDLEDVTND